MVPRFIQVDKAEVVDLEKSPFFQPNESGVFLLRGGVGLAIFCEFLIIRLRQLVCRHVHPLRH